MINHIDSFEDTLTEVIDRYSGKYADIIYYLPQYYRFFLNLLDNPKTPARQRLYVNAALSYLLSPMDVIPEEEVGVEGYIDDVYLSSYAARKIINTISRKEILSEAWEGDEPLEEITDAVITDCGNVLNKEVREQVLTYVGLQEIG